MKPAPLAVIVTLPFVGQAMAAADEGITTRKLSETSYELTIEVTSKVDVTHAQELLRPKAQSICGSQPVHFGHYAFEAIQQLNGSTPAPDGSLIARQEITCGEHGLEKPTGHVSYTWTPAASDAAAVEAMTYQYLRDRDSGDVKSAYGRFSDGMKEATRFESWSQSVSAFNSTAGAVEFRKVQAISWVKDPPGVDAGFYAAVDFTSRFAKVPFHCGYVAWYRDALGDFTIVREEENFIDQASAARMGPDQIQAALRSFGCVTQQ